MSGRSPAARFLAQLLQQFQSVHARHLDVEDRKVGRIFEQAFSAASPSA
jgi:hypothetical protein